MTCDTLLHNAAYDRHLTSDSVKSNYFFNLITFQDIKFTIKLAIFFNIKCAEFINILYFYIKRKTCKVEF